MYFLPIISTKSLVFVTMLLKWDHYLSIKTFSKYKLFTTPKVIIISSKNSLKFSIIIDKYSSRGLLSTSYILYEYCLHDNEYQHTQSV